MTTEQMDIVDAHIVDDEYAGMTDLERIEKKLDKVLLFASEMNKVVEGLTPIIADIEQKGIGSIFTMLMGGRKK